MRGLPDFGRVAFEALGGFAQPREEPLYGVGMPGFAPFVRGPYATMYRTRPWTIRQYAGFSTAEESNAFYRAGLRSGQTGLSVAFDLPTHRGYDSDHPLARGDVGMAGVAIDSIEDMRILFRDIPLDQVSVSMTMNGAVLPVLALFIVTAEEQGVPQSKLRGTIQNDILKEFLVRNTYIYPPVPSLRIVADVMAYAAQHMPRFNPVSVSGYHMLEAGASPQLELAYTLADALEYVRAGLGAGLALDAFAPRISFFFGIGMNFCEEIAKLRAARLLWARLLQPYEPNDQRSIALRMHCQTSGWSLAATEVYNNIVRTMVEAMAAVCGQTQSLHTNAFDEALALPTDFSAKVARDTQRLLQQEIGLTHVIDPWGGSVVIEQKTKELAEAAASRIDEVEALGGMARAIEHGLPKRRIEESAVAMQAALDSGVARRIGVNCHRPPDVDPVPIRMLDASAVRDVQEKRLRELRERRDPQRVRQALDMMTTYAQTDGANLLEAAVKAARACATVGEMSLALENVFGRYEATGHVVTGLYGGYMERDGEFTKVRERVGRFLERHGRRPRILIAKLGQDGHDRGQKVVAAAFADLGFDVDLGTLFQTPEDVARQAVENDVHVVGISSLAAGHRALVPALLQALRDFGREDIRVVVGGVVPEEDRGSLHEAGVAAVVGPGATAVEGAGATLDALEGAESAPA